MSKQTRPKPANSKIYLGAFVLAALLVGYFTYITVSQQSETQSIASSSTGNLLTTTKHHQSVVAATVKLADKFHYRNKPLNNEFSKEILQEYLATLDPQKAYFLSSDIVEFESNRLYYDNYLKGGKLNEVFKVFTVYQQRVKERADYAISLLDYPFDFSLDQELKLDRSNSNWSLDQEEQDDLWKHLVKDDILTLRLNGESEEQVSEILGSRYERFRNSIAMSNAFDVIELFLNSYLKELDPHSEFFSPHSSSNLKISISQEIEGIGAMLRNEREHTVVQGIIAGGPAHLSKRLHVGDRIVAVGNGDGSKFRDIVGWRLEDVVDLIRGPKGTTVHLKVLRKDAVPGAGAENIALVRQKVKLEEQMAKKSTVEIEAEGEILQLGIIQLPAFYSNFMGTSDSDGTSSSSASDVRRHLTELRDQGVDGIVIDLRGNGGGALQQAVQLTGMFIPSGPVVQVEDSENNLDVYEDTNIEVIYEGPLVVLVDRRSASASEIFAGAIQDYGRGVVVGETTFGKGTLQNIWPLNQLAKNDDIDLGALKISTAQFFRVNGTSTQHLGIVPDVIFPTNAFVANSGERALENALLGSVIEPSKHTNPWHQKDKIENKIPELRRLNRIRMELNPLMNVLVERDELTFHRSVASVVSLNEELRKNTLDEDREEQLAYINEVRSLFNLEPADSVSNDVYPSEQIGDVFVDEAVNILTDLITLDVSDTKIGQES